MCTAVVYMIFYISICVIADISNAYSCVIMDISNAYTRVKVCISCAWKLAKIHFYIHIQQNSYQTCGRTMLF